MPPRDYKRPLAQPKPKQPWPAWAMLSAGVMLGLFIAFLVYLAGLPAVTETPTLSLPKPTPAPAVAPKVVEKPAPAPPPKPRFDFYTILPELEVVVPEPDPLPVPETAATTNTPAADAAAATPAMRKGERYFLQAGSFRSTAEADRLKASLTLLGLDVMIQSVSVDGTQWHRVRVGPYENARSLNEARARLRENRIDFMTLKANAPG